MPIFQTQPRYRALYGPPPISPGVLSPDDDDLLSGGYTPGTQSGPDNLLQQQSAPTPPPAPAPDAPKIPGTAGAASTPLPTMAEASGAGPVPPPLRKATGALPPSEPVPGQMDHSIATSNAGPQPPVDSSGPGMEETPDAQPPSTADQLAAKRAEVRNLDAGVHNNFLQRLALAALSVTRLAPLANSIVHPAYTAQRGALERQVGDLAAQQQDEQTLALNAAKIQEEQQHGNYWEQRGQQEKNRFHTDPKTGAIFDSQSGTMTQPPKSLQDRISEYVNAGFSPADARLLAVGQKLEPTTVLPDALADSLQLPHGSQVPTQHLASFVTAANKPDPNKTEAQLAMDAANGDQSAKTALDFLAKTRLAGSPKFALAGNGASGPGTDDTAQSWANSIRSGSANMAQVPQKHRDAVIKLLNGSPAPLSSTAATALSQTEPVAQQVKRLLDQLEPLKGNDTPGYFLPDRVGYALGRSGSLGGLLADLSMAGVQGATRILKGGSRSQFALQRALDHTPNVWVDSPKNAYEKLQRMYQNLTDGITAIRQEGSKYGVEGAVPSKAPGSPAAEVDPAVKAYADRYFGGDVSKAQAAIAQQGGQ